MHPGKPIVVGDSHAAMWPASGQQSELGTSLVNLGVGNDRVSNLIYRLNRADFSKADAPYIVVLVGTNDIKIDEEPAVIVSKITAAVKILEEKSANTPIFVSEVFPWCEDPGSKNDRVAETNELLSAQAEMHGFTVISIFKDLSESCSDGASKFYRDRIHLNAKGYALLGRKVATSLRSNE